MLFTAILISIILDKIKAIYPITTKATEIFSNMLVRVDLNVGSSCLDIFSNCCKSNPLDNVIKINATTNIHQQERLIVVIPENLAKMPIKEGNMTIVLVNSFVESIDLSTIHFASSEISLFSFIMFNPPEIVFLLHTQLFRVAL